MKRSSKKSETLDIRLPYEQKRAFMRATKQNGETASQVLRRYIASYVEAAQATESKTTVQEITMTLVRHKFKTLASALGAVGAAVSFAAVTALPSAADPSAFDILDKNEDGVITAGEIFPGDDEDIVAHLDADDSGDVSRAEFEAAGEEIRIERSDSSVGEDGEERKSKQVKVLRFSDGEGSDHLHMSSTGKKRVSVKFSRDNPLSEEEIEDIVKQALEGADISEIGADIEIEIEKETVQE